MCVRIEGVVAVVGVACGNIRFFVISLNGWISVVDVFRSYFLTKPPRAYFSDKRDWEPHLQKPQTGPLSGDPTPQTKEKSPHSTHRRFRLFRKLRIGRFAFPKTTPRDTSLDQVKCLDTSRGNVKFPGYLSGKCINAMILVGKMPGY